MRGLNGVRKETTMLTFRLIYFVHIGRLNYRIFPCFLVHSVPVYIVGITSIFQVDLLEIENVRITVLDEPLTFNKLN